LRPTCLPWTLAPLWRDIVHCSAYGASPGQHATVASSGIVMSCSFMGVQASGDEIALGGMLLEAALVQDVLQPQHGFAALRERGGQRRSIGSRRLTLRAAESRTVLYSAYAG